MEKSDEPAIWVYDMCSKEYGDSWFDRVFRSLAGLRYWAHPGPYPSGDGLAYGYTVAMAARRARKRLRRRGSQGGPRLAAKVGGTDV